MEAEKQLSLFLLKLLMILSKKNKKRGDISSNILDYFNAENPDFGRFYLLPKIHKRMYDYHRKTRDF